MNINFRLNIIIISCTFLLFISFNSFSQKINYDELYVEINDQSSEFYYPKLLDRFEKGDTSLTNEDFRYLYYGFTYQEAYRPYDRDPRDNEISNLMSQGISEETAPRLIEVSKQYLAEQPFNLKINYYLKNFLEGQGDDSLKTILDFKFQGIIDAILSSGDGLSKKTAYAVNSPSDEYMVLRTLGLKTIDNESETTYDYFKLAPNEQNIEGIYFDVYQMAKIGTAHIGITTIEVENEVIPDDGIEVGSEEEILSYIPLGFKTLEKINADFDVDGDQDWLLLLVKEGEELLSNNAIGDPEKRLTIYLERGKDGLLNEVWRNLNVIPCVDCGDGQDPYLSFSFDENQIILKTMGGGLFVWERETVFEFTGNDFQLIEEKFTSYRKGNKAKAQTEIETPEDFGLIFMKDFDYYKLLQ